MTVTSLLAQAHGPILVLTLNKPHKLNALDAAMLTEMAARIRAADEDDDVAAIVVTGAGRAFCAGFDMTGGGSGAMATAPPAQRQRANLENLLAIWRARKPVIAAVDGYALGAGCILACLCDIVLASERATFGEPEIRYWNPATITILPWIIGVRRAKKLLLYGNKLDAQTAQDYGIVSDILPIDGFFDAVMDAVRPLTHLHPAAVAAAKRSVNRGVEIAGFLDALSAGIDEIGPLYGPDSPTAPIYRRELETIGFREYIRRRDLLFRD